MHRSRVSALALAACLTPGTLLAQDVCLSPGALVRVDASAVTLDLGEGQPGIVLAHSDGRTRARVTDVGDDGTITFRVPLTGLPPGAQVAIYAVRADAEVRIPPDPDSDSTPRAAPPAVVPPPVVPVAPAPVRTPVADDGPDDTATPPPAPTPPTGFQPPESPENDGGNSEGALPPPGGGGDAGGGDTGGGDTGGGDTGGGDTGGGDTGGGDTGGGDTGGGDTGGGDTGGGDTGGGDTGGGDTGGGDHDPGDGGDHDPDDDDDTDDDDDSDDGDPDDGEDDDFPELNWRLDGREHIRYATAPGDGLPRPLLLRVPDLFAGLARLAGPETLTPAQAVIATPQPILPLALATICADSGEGTDGVPDGAPGDLPALDAPPALVLANAPPALVTAVAPPELLTASLGFGEGGLPDDFRAGPDVVPAPTDAPEFALILPIDDVDAAVAVIESLGGRVIRSESLDLLGVNMVVVDMQGGVTADEVRAALAFDGIEADFDANHLYFPAQAAATVAPAPVRVYANEMVGAVPAGSCRLTAPVRVGLIDGPVDATHPYLRNVALTVHSVLGEDDAPAFGEHATALASLIAADPADDGFTGIAPGAEVLAAVAFSTHDGRPAASMEHIARAMDWLLSQGVAIINMSISGPENRVFRRLLAVAAERGAVLVGASGNDARPEVAWPAAAPEVIAVTAVDAGRALYPLASYGDKVEFAAPGVDVLVAEPGGTAYRSGTSYAAAVLSALAAHKLGAEGVVTPEDVRAALRDTAEDLGPEGRDDRFGYGLVRLPGCVN